jgi:amino acid transporter
MSKSKLGFNATWSMAVGGMVGGGIFSTLGVVVGVGGAWAWLSFAAAGLIALASGYSYVKLSTYYGEGGLHTGFGVLAGATASVALIVRLISTDPLALVSLGLLVLIAMFGRPLLLRRVKTENRPG